MKRFRSFEAQPGLPPAVAVENLHVVRGHRIVLHDVSLTVPRGRVTGLLGPSGSGKTTLLRCVVGSQIVAGGMVEVLGLPAGSAALRRRVSYVTQSLAVYGDLTTRENLAFFARVMGVETARVNQVTELVALADHIDQLVRNLSDGQRARVSLACALLCEPELLILDEPTAGLDPILRRSLWSLFRQMALLGTTLLVSSHVMDEASRCDQLLLLNEGRVVANGSPDDLCERTNTHDVESAFLSLIETDR